MDHKSFITQIEQIREKYPISPGPDWAGSGKLRIAAVYGGYLSRRLVDLVGDYPGLWYEPLLPPTETMVDYTPEVADMLQEARVNLVVIGYFSKNFGFKVERPQYEQCARFIYECHQRGIRAMVYISFANIHKTLIEEMPEVVTWVQQNADGTSKTYGPHGERLHGCYNNPGWFEYQKKVAINVVQSGADGVFIDNTGINLGGCYCGFCREGFKEFTRERFGETRSLPTVQDWTDPLWQAFIEFRYLTHYRGLMRFSHYVSILKEDIVVAVNTSHNLPGGPPGSEKACYVPNSGDYQGLITSEDNRSPGMEAERIQTRINNYKVLAAAARGKPVAIFGYPKDYKNPTPNGLELAIAEALAHNAALIAPWRIMYSNFFNLPVLREVVKKLNSFHQRNEDYYVDVRTRAQVAVIHSINSVGGWYKHKIERPASEDGPSGEDDFTRTWSFVGCTQALLESQIPYDVVLAESLTLDQLSGYDCLILPNVACMDDDLIETVKTFVRQGGNILATYETSLYDGYGQRRENYGLRELFGTEQKGSAEGIAVKNYGKGKTIFFSDKPDYDFCAKRDETTRKLLVGAIDKLVARCLLLSNAPRTIVVNLTEKENLSVLHLLNLEADAGAVSVEDIAVQIALSQEKRVQRVVALSPDWEGEVELKLEVASDILEFTVPQLKIYTVVAVEFEGYRRPQVTGEETQLSEKARPKEISKQEKAVGDLLTGAV